MPAGAGFGVKWMSIFDDLFVLELANNHLGRLQRGLEIIDAFGHVVRSRGVRAAIKLQFRDVDSFIHADHRRRQDVRYIKKVGATRLQWGEHAKMVDAVRAAGMVTMATPFDEPSVDKCVEFGIEILKIASSDIRDRSLLDKIASTGRPVIASTGGASLQDTDDLVDFFQSRGIEFALNHCVSIYPSRDGELELNQIDFIRRRYAGIVVGFSTHEMTDWRSSITIAYAKGARTFERHIDIDTDGVQVSPYCTLPNQADQWFEAYWKAREMCGGPATSKRDLPEKEIRYLDELVRGVYAKRDLPGGKVLTKNDIYFAVPLLNGQISVREFEGGEVLRSPVAKDSPLRIGEIDTEYSYDLVLRRLLEKRGLKAVPLSDDETTPKQSHSA